MAPCQVRTVWRAWASGLRGIWDVMVWRSSSFSISGRKPTAACGAPELGVADDEGLFVLEEGEDGVHADPLRVPHELGEADGGVVFGVIGLGVRGVLGRPAGRTGDGADADGEGGGAGECDGDDVGPARGAGVEAAEVPEFLDGLDAEVVGVLDVVHDLGEAEVPEVDGLGGRVLAGGFPGFSL